MANLDEKDVEKLILYGCNEGHADYIGTNPASQFSAKVNGAPVLANDGIVYSSRNSLHFWSLGMIRIADIYNYYTRFWNTITYEPRVDPTFRSLLLNGQRDN